MSILKSVVEKTIDDQIVTDRDIALLDAMARKMSWNEKQCEYHVLLAKKMLWDNPMSKQARIHIRKAMTIEFWSAGLVDDASEFFSWNSGAEMLSLYEKIIS